MLEAARHGQSKVPFKSCCAGFTDLADLFSPHPHSPLMVFNCANNLSQDPVPFEVDTEGTCEWPGCKAVLRIILPAGRGGARL